LAGFDDLLVVGRHGRVTVNRAHDPHALRGKLSSGELAKLRLQIAAAHLAHARSRPEHGCCDMIDIWIYASGHAVRNAPETGGPVNSLGQHLQRILDRTITAATPG
jgi:hypothetical protein